MKRRKMDFIYDALKHIHGRQKGLVKTKLMYKVNLRSDVYNNLLKGLEKHGLVVINQKGYPARVIITKVGDIMLQNLNTIIKIIKEV